MAAYDKDMEEVSLLSLCLPTIDLLRKYCPSLLLDPNSLGFWLILKNNCDSQHCWINIYWILRTFIYEQPSLDVLDHGKLFNYITIYILLL